MNCDAQCQAEDYAFDVSGTQHLFYGPTGCSGVQEATQEDLPGERTPEAQEATWTP